MVFGLCVGYPTDAGKGEVKPRLAQPMIVHHERYDAASADAHRKAHDEEMKKFTARNEMQVGTWTQRVLNRLGPIASMNGRERMRAALTALGFEIR